MEKEIGDKIKELISKINWNINFEFSKYSEIPNIICNTRILKDECLRLMGCLTECNLNNLDIEINNSISVIVTSLKLEKEYIYLDMYFSCPDPFKNLDEVKEIIPLSKLNFKTKILENMITEKESEIKYLKSILRS